MRRGGQVARVQVDEDDVEQGPGAIVGVRELGQKLELLIRQVVGVREISAFPGGIAERLERERAQVGVPESLGDRLQRACRRLVLVPR